MKNLFEHTSAPWFRYNSDEYKAADNGSLYIMVSKGAKPEMYHPMLEGEQLVIDAINIGLAAMHKAPEEELKGSVLGFIQKYGFLGFMNALPTTVDFITYESVYLPKNHFIAERYDWIVKEFTDLAFIFMTSFLYYLDCDSIDEDTCNLYRQGISAFGGISPTYRIALEKDSPVIVWDFHSLLVMVQMCFSFMLTDKDSDMRMCKHCKKLLSLAEKEMNFAAHNVKISLMSINQGKRRRGTKEMIENRNVNIITDADGKKLVLINDIRFKGKRQIN